jgi:phosphohistidine phosphatase
MIILMLLRHAKSNLSHLGQADVGRSLNDRGKRDALAIGRHMASHNLEPQLVLCSPAKRAKDTWEIVAKKLKTSPLIKIEPDIYDFGDGTTLMELLSRQGGDAKSILLVGHNPSIEGLAQKLVERGSDQLRQRLANKFPTATLAVISLDLENWKAVKCTSGTLLHFVRPKDVLGTAIASSTRS